MARHQLPGAIDASRDDAGRGIFLEALAERAALASVEREHPAVLREPRKCAVDHAPRHPRRRGFPRHGGQEGVEVAAALRGAGGRREEQDAKQDRGGSQQRGSPRCFSFGGSSHGRTGRQSTERLRRGGVTPPPSRIGCKCSSNFDEWASTEHRSSEVAAGGSTKSQIVVFMFISLTTVLFCTCCEAVRRSSTLVHLGSRWSWRRIIRGGRKWFSDWLFPPWRQ